MSSTVKIKLINLLKQKGSGTLDLKNAFVKFDKKQQGILSYEEFIGVLNGYGIYPTSSDARILFLELDTDNDGYVSYLEFLKIMRGIIIFIN
jgi:Ca2+-binding EF-hand superfamily protein